MPAMSLIGRYAVPLWQGKYHLRGSVSGAKRFSSAWLVALFVVILGAGFLFSWPGTIGYAGYALSALLALGALLLPIPLALAVVLVTLAGPDIVQGQSEVLEVGGRLVGSPWRLGVGPITPGVFQALVYLALLLRMLPVKPLSITTPFIAYASAVGVLGYVATVLIKGEAGVPTSWVVSNARMIIVLLLSGTLWYTALCRYPHRAYQLCQLLFVVLLVRFLWDVVLWLTGTGAYLSGASRGSVDSAHWTVLVIVFFSLHRLMARQRVGMSLALLGLGVAMTLAYMVRMTYVTCVVGTIIAIAAAPRAHRKIIGISVLAIMAALGVALMQQHMAEAYRIYMIRLARLAPLLQLNAQESDTRRYMELENCLGEMANDGTIITGRGFGAYYTDSIIYMDYDFTDAFPDWAMQTRHFPRVHSMIGDYILKFGLVGLALWLLLWYRLFLRLWRARPSAPHWEGVRVALLTIAPAVLASGYWSSKGMFVTGLYLALAYHLSSRTVPRALPPGRKVLAREVALASPVER